MTNKRVESFWAPCLDAGSTPATSTQKRGSFAVISDDPLYSKKL